MLLDDLFGVVSKYLSDYQGLTVHDADILKRSLVFKHQSCGLLLGILMHKDQRFG